MTDKFLGTGSVGGNIANGTLSIYGSKIGAKNLDPSRAVKTDSQGRLQTTDLDIADVNNLQSVLDNVLTNPYTPPIGEKFVVNGDIDCTDTVSAPSMALDRLFDSSKSISIDLDSTTVNIVAPYFKVNGQAIPSVDRIIALESKTQNITADADFTVFSDILQASDIRTDRITDIIGDGASIDITQTAISMYVPTLDPILTLNNRRIITDEYDGNILIAGTTTSSEFIKLGGTNQQYLMGDGSSLQYSSNSGNSNYYLYNNSTTQNSTPPNGDLTYNTATQNIASIIYISHRTRDNIDIEIFFKQLSTLTDVYIQDQESGLNYIQYNIIGTPTITAEFQVAIPVNLRTGAGTGLSSFGGGHNILVSFFTNSIETDLRITNLENASTTTNANVSVALSRTQYQFSSAGSTTFIGGKGIITDKFTKIGGGSANEFVKSNGTFDSSTYIQASGTSRQYLKGNGTFDDNSYTNTQYLMNVSPAILSNSIVETNIFGTGLTTNNMSMVWTDALNYSRTIYIAGKISHNANATLTIRFRISGGTIIIPWVINLSNTSVATSIPFTMTMNYTIKATNSYTYSCSFCEAGITAGTTYMSNSTVTCNLGSYNRLITAQWGAVGAQNSLEITELNIKNNYVG
jgi:hypothetical protein